ncbi:cysteine desulfurase [Afipia sp. Root123D2]|uniref:cysteine desulfurase family protein n=1 Tax=Afipia sp. Root123D2 TaxID=1736436 RepID=UPI0006FE99E1|nr:cysteine desulfurase family protein [Afipia sp. Root123D2]KQW23174.1 cysteine desulfurase [Afipia sp. Root123D2]
MTRKRVYLDWNATAPLRPEARAAMEAAWDVAGNPSSVHAEGRAARRLVEEARNAVARATGAEARNVIFTSGGTEANALALTPGLRRPNGAPVQRLMVSAIEHPSVLAGGRFDAADIAVAPVDRTGVVDLERLRNLLDDPVPSLVSVMLANNETGAIQPIPAIAAMVHQAGGVMHVDAVQALSKISCNINQLTCDLLSISAHKVGGPKGVGALVVADGVSGFDALIRGGGQEKGRRGGTENVPGIVGLGAAVAAAMASAEQESARLKVLQAQLETGLATVPETMIFSREISRLPNTTLATVPGMKAETAVIGFDLEGIAVSSGSACSSGKVQPSHVLAAMGVPPPLAQGAIRISLGWDTSESDIIRVLEAWRKLADALGKKMTRIGT